MQSVLTTSALIVRLSIETLVTIETDERLQAFSASKLIGGAWDVMLPHRRIWQFRSSGLWRSFAKLVFTGVSKAHLAFIFKDLRYSKCPPLPFILSCHLPPVPIACKNKRAENGFERNTGRKKLALIWFKLREMAFFRRHTVYTYKMSNWIRNF